MKKILSAAITVVLLAVSLPRAQAQSAPERTVEDCIAEVRDLIEFVEVLEFSKKKHAKEERKELKEELKKAIEQLEDGGGKKFYKAAKNVFEVCEEVAELGEKRKVNGFQAAIFVAWAADTVDSIVELYAPDYKCLDCP